MNLMQFKKNRGFQRGGVIIYGRSGTEEKRVG
jgi:hypothetical protein